MTDVTGWTRWAVAGSTAVEVAAYAGCPVAMIRSRREDELPTSGPIVVGIDGSATSEMAVAIAFAEASARAVEVVSVLAWTEFAVGPPIGTSDSSRDSSAGQWPVPVCVRCGRGAGSLRRASACGEGAA